MSACQLAFTNAKRVGVIVAISLPVDTSPKAITRRGKPAAQAGSPVPFSSIRTVTVGSGVAPDLLTLPSISSLGKALAGLTARRPHTAGGDFHPALRTRLLLAKGGRVGNEGGICKPVAGRAVPGFRFCVIRRTLAFSRGLENRVDEPIYWGYNNSMRDHLRSVEARSDAQASRPRLRAGGRGVRRPHDYGSGRPPRLWRGPLDHGWPSRRSPGGHGLDGKRGWPPRHLDEALSCQGRKIWAASKWVDSYYAPALTRTFFDRAEIRHGDKLIRRGRPPLDTSEAGGEAAARRRRACRLSSDRQTAGRRGSTRICGRRGS